MFKFKLRSRHYFRLRSTQRIGFTAKLLTFKRLSPKTNGVKETYFLQDIKYILFTLHTSTQ